MTDTASPRNVEHKTERAPSVTTRAEPSTAAVESSPVTMGEASSESDKAHEGRGLRLLPRSGKGRHRAQ